MTLISLKVDLINSDHVWSLIFMADVMTCCGTAQCQEEEVTDWIEGLSACMDAGYHWELQSTMEKKGMRDWLTPPQALLAGSRHGHKYHLWVTHLKCAAVLSLILHVVECVNCCPNVHWLQVYVATYTYNDWSTTVSTNCITCHTWHSSS